MKSKKTKNELYQEAWNQSLALSYISVIASKIDLESNGYEIDPPFLDGMHEKSVKAYLKKWGLTPESLSKMESEPIRAIIQMEASSLERLLNDLLDKPSLMDMFEKMLLEKLGDMEIVDGGILGNFGDNPDSLFPDQEKEDGLSEEEFSDIPGWNADDPTFGGGGPIH